MALFSANRATAQTIDTRKAEADRLLQQGIEQFQNSQVAAAIQSWQQALTIYREVKDRQSEGVVLGTLGEAYAATGNYGKAIEYLQPFLSIAREKSDRSLEGRILEKLGIAYNARENFSKAIEYHQQNLVIAREIGNRRSEAAALGNLGVAYKALGDYVKAINYYQQTLIVKQEINDKLGEAKALGNLGNVWEALGEYAKAIENYDRSLAIAKTIKDAKAELIALGSLGAIYANQGDASKAIEYYQQSLRIAKKIGDRSGEGNALNNLGAAYHSQGNNAKAIECYGQSLAIAKEMGDRQIEIASLINTGIAYKVLDDIPRAVDNLEQSLAIAKSIGDISGESLALHNLGLVLFKARKLKEAEAALRNAIELRESLRPRLDDASKVSIFDTQVLTYGLLQKVLVAQNKPEASLEIAERGRARAFVELLATRLSNKFKTQIQSAPPTIEQLKQIAKAQNATLVEYSIAPEESLFQGKLRGKASELFIWVVRPAGKVAFRSVDLKKSLTQQQEQAQGTDSATFEKLVTNSRIFQGPGSRLGKAARAQLHQLLIQPVADLLPKDADDRVIFIPHESLFLLPFPALQDSKGEFLVKKHTILTAPAIQVLELTRQKRQSFRMQKTVPPQGKDFLVVGNPTMPAVPAIKGKEKPAPLQQLPASEREALLIASLLNTKALIGNEATKVDIVRQLPDMRLIHLATHGLLDDIKELGVPGAIALAPSPGDDGFLTSSEILNLKLNAELVVLSACNTGRGKITGDGVIGLSRSLISAGVPSVVVSLWAVPDVPTSFLMTQFYRNLQKNPDKAKALRQAMLTTMQQHPNPLDWAAFTLIGEAE